MPGHQDRDRHRIVATPKAQKGHCDCNKGLAEMTKKILSIDGGGVRGLIPAIVLREIERRTERPAHELFDVIAGTSTGAIISLLATRKTASAEPYPASEIVEIYKDVLPRFFTPRWWALRLSKPKYKSGPPSRVLQEYLGDAQLKDAPTRVLIPVYALREKIPRVIFFTSLAAGHDEDENFLCWEVGRGATAAPTYFSAFDVTSMAGTETHCAVDGGVFANNPTMHGWLHAYQEYDSSRDLRFRRIKIPEDTSVKDAVVVSLGTGRPDRPIVDKSVAKGGLLDWARPIVDVMFEGQSDAVNELLDEAKTGDLLAEHFRLQPILEGNIKLDDLDAIDDLVRIAERFVDDQEDEIDRICRLLERDVS